MLVTSSLFGRLQKWLFLSWLLLPALMRERALRWVGQFFSPTSQAALLTLAQLGGSGGSVAPLDFGKRCFESFHPRLLYRLSHLGFDWLRHQRRLRAIDQHWGQVFPRTISLEAVGQNRILDGSLLARVMEECEREGTSVYILSNRESFRHPRLISIMRSFPGSLFVVHTEPQIVNELVVDAISRCGNVFLFLALAGFEKETDEILGPGTWAATHATLKLLQERGIPFGINLVTRRDNYRVVISDGFIEQLVNLGVSILQYDVFTAGDPRELSLQIGASDRIEVAKKAVQIRNTYPVFAMEPMMESLEHGGCAAQNGFSLHVDVNGDVFPCRHLRHSDHSLTEGRSLREILNRHGFLHTLRKGTNAPPKGCLFFEACDFALDSIKRNNREVFGKTPMMETLTEMEKEPSHWSLKQPAQLGSQDSYRDLLRFFYRTLAATGS